MTCFQCGNPIATPIIFTETNGAACPDCVIAAVRAGVLPAQAQARLTGAALIALINRAEHSAAPVQQAPARRASKPAPTAEQSPCRRCQRLAPAQYALCYECYQAQPVCDCGQAKRGWSDAAQDWFETCYECSSRAA